MQTSGNMHDFTRRVGDCWSAYLLQTIRPLGSPASFIVLTLHIRTWKPKVELQTRYIPKDVCQRIFKHHTCANMIFTAITYMWKTLKRKEDQLWLVNHRLVFQGLHWRDYPLLPVMLTIFFLNRSYEKSTTEPRKKNNSDRGSSLPQPY